MTAFEPRWTAPGGYIAGVGDLRFTPEKWGPGLFRLAAPGGAHLLVRWHGAPELALWLPAGRAPRTDERFGVYLHPDEDFASSRVAGHLRRAVGVGSPVRPFRHPEADRLAAMLCVHDLTRAGMSLRDLAEQLVSPIPADWRSSSVRSDLRRPTEQGAEMVEGGYRMLLRSRYPQGR